MVISFTSFGDMNDHVSYILQHRKNSLISLLSTVMTNVIHIVFSRWSFGVTLWEIFSQGTT